MTNRRAVFECCVDSIESAVAAANGGAMRLEICSSLAEGGITPSLGLFLQIRRRFPDLFLAVLVRPRGGDFHYSADEIEVMVEDINAFRTNGADGIVVGALTKEGEYDEAAMEKFILAADFAEVTFHRAVDLAHNPKMVLEKCQNMGVRRILTSGGAPTAHEGRFKIREMVEIVNYLFPGELRDNFVVAAASGISETNAVETLNDSGADQLHGSLRVEKRKPDFDFSKTVEAEGSKSKVIKMDLMEQFGKVYVTSQDRLEKLLSRIAWREESGTDHARPKHSERVSS